MLSFLRKSWDGIIYVDVQLIMVTDQSFHCVVKHYREEKGKIVVVNCAYIVV